MLPRRRLQQAGEHFDGGGFARAVGAQKSEELTCLHAQVDAAHRFQLSEAAAESVRFHCEVSHVGFSRLEYHSPYRSEGRISGRMGDMRLGCSQQSAKEKIRVDLGEFVLFNRARRGCTTDRAN